MAGDVPARRAADSPCGANALLISPPAFARTDFLQVMGGPPVRERCGASTTTSRATTRTPRRLHAGPVPSSESETGRSRRGSTARAQGAPVFLGEFGASRWAVDVRDAYYRARSAACEALGVNWAAVPLADVRCGLRGSDDMYMFQRAVRGADADARSTIEDLPRLDEEHGAAWARTSRTRLAELQQAEAAGQHDGGQRAARAKAFLAGTTSPSRRRTPRPSRAWRKCRRPAPRRIRRAPSRRRASEQTPARDAGLSARRGGGDELLRARA